MSASRTPPRGFSHPGFGDVAAALARHAGLKVPAHRYPDLERAARRGMARARVEDPAEYARQLAAGTLPLADLVGAFTVGETYFFRDPPQFDLIRDRVVPEVLASRPPTHVLRAWSAGCASGEEPYSLAMLFDGMGLSGRFRVLGTDISRPALGRARAATYGSWSVRGPARAAALRALDRDGERYVVPPRLRAAVRIEYLNLAEDAYPSVLNATAGLDLVLCRNVFIYFEREVVAAVARRMHACLAEGGWLFTGLADPPLAPYAPFQSISTEAGVVYRKPVRGEPAGIRLGLTETPDEALTPASPVPVPVSVPGPVTRVPPPVAPGPWPAPTPTPSSAHPERSVREADAESKGTPTPTPDRAAALARAGDWSAILSLADELIAAPDGAAMLVRAAANSGDLDRADDLSARATERHPLVPELHLLRAATLAEVGRVDDALAAVNRALYLDRRLAVAHAALAGLLSGRGDRDAARRAWRTVRRLCDALPPDAVLPLGDGECAGRLSAIASAQLSMLGGDPER